MSRKVGLNVALNLSTQGFSNSLNKAKGDMRQFTRDIRRQNEVLGKLGMAGFGRGFGIAGGLAEGFAMGGVGGGVAAVAAPMAALAGTIMFVENLNSFRREASRSLEDFNRKMSEGKIEKLVTDSQSAFALLAGTQEIVEGPGVYETFKQALASSTGGQRLLTGAKGFAGGLGDWIGSLIENPLSAVGPGGLVGPGANPMLGLGQAISGERFQSAFDVGTAQNTAQAQVAAESLKELKKQTAAMQGN